MPATNRFHFPPPTDDREELFGQLKYGTDWQGLPTQADLELLNARFYPPNEYVTEEERLSPAPVPIEDLEYRGLEQLRDQALATRDRFVKSKRQFAEVRELIRLLNRYGYQSTIPEPLERVDPGDDRQKLREARRLAAQLVPVTGSNAVPMQRGPKSAPSQHVGRPRGRPPEKSDAAKEAMLDGLRSKRISAAELRGMKEKELVDRYGHIAKRTILREARKAALSEF